MESVIPTQPASQVTVNIVLNNSKIVTAALMGGLIVLTTALTLASYIAFDQGVLQNEPEFSMILNVAGIVLWLILIFAGYFVPDILFGRAESKIFSEGEQRLSLQSGSDAKALQQAMDALDVETRASIF